MTIISDTTKVWISYSEHTAIAHVPSDVTLGSLIYSAEVQMVREAPLEPAGKPDTLCSASPIMTSEVNKTVTVKQCSKLSRGSNVILFSPLSVDTAVNMTDLPTAKESLLGKLESLKICSVFLVLMAGAKDC
jgi:hypothetical protein